MSPSRNSIWFRLVDQEGHSFRGTSADKIRLSFCPDVADFRQAVKAQYDQPLFLKDIPPGALKVYSDLTHFHADLGKQNPLKPSLSLSGMGTDEDSDTALLVLVPSGKPSLGLLLPLRFTPHRLHIQDELLGR